MNALLKIRKTLGMTQSEVERTTGIDSSTLSLYENGIRLPTIKNAKKLGELYGVSWMVFYTEGDDNDEGRVGSEA